MRKHLPGRARWVLQKIIIPTAVVTSSASILAISYWYHEQQLQQQLQNANPSVALAQQVETQQQPTPTKTQTNSTVKPHVPTKPNKKQTKAKSNGKGKQKTKTTTPTTKTVKDNSGSGRTKTGTSNHDQTKSAGSTTQPGVIGGSIQTVKNGQVSNTTMKTSVIQYGQNPQATGIAGSLTDSKGHRLTIPTNINTNRLLAMPLQHGVLWAVMAPTAIRDNGQLGPADAPTYLMYTPFPQTGQASLTSGSTIVGRIPVSMSKGQTLGTSWTIVNQADNPYRQPVTIPESPNSNVTTTSRSLDTTGNRTANKPTAETHGTGNRTSNNKTANSTALVAHNQSTNETSVATASKQIAGIAPTNTTNSTSTATSSAAVKKSVQATNSTSNQTVKANSAMTGNSSTTNRTANGAINNTEKNTTSNVTNNTSSNTTNNATSSTANSTTNTSKTTAPTAPTGDTIYLSNIQRTGTGAVIVLDVMRNNGDLTRIAYLYNETADTVQKLVKLPNDGIQFSWLAVGQHNIYWGIRTVNKNNPSTYKEKQILYSIDSGKTQNIGLGTWTGAVYVHNDDLVFQIGNSTKWEQFTPSTSSN